MNYSQKGQGVLQGGQIGERVRNALNRGEGSSSGGPNLGQGAMSNLDVPSNPGPALAGRTPLVGTLRRSQGMPVLRDQLADSMG